MIKERFLHYLSTEKRYSDNTLEAYSNDIDQFIIYLEEDFQIKDISTANHVIIRSWIVSLMSKDYSTRSINRKLSTLKTFFWFLRKEGIVTDNPLQHVHSPKTEKNLPEFASKTSMNLLLDEIEFGESFDSICNRLIIEILYLTGMRVSELVNLRIYDIDVINRQLKVSGKGNKERLIPFNDYLGKSVASYLTARNNLFESNSNDFLLLSNKGKKLNRQYVYRTVNFYLGLVSTLKKKSPHVLRHSFATHMLDNGADLNSIKDILGHASLAATQVYTHNSIEKIKKVYNQAHPRA